MLKYFSQQKSWKKIRVTIPLPPLPFINVGLCSSHRLTHTGAFFLIAILLYTLTPHSEDQHCDLDQTLLCTTCHDCSESFQPYQSVQYPANFLPIFRVFRTFPSDGQVLSRTTSPYAKPPACIWWLHCFFFCHDCLAEPVFDRSLSSGLISKGPSLTTAQDCLSSLHSSGIC